MGNVVNLVKSATARNQADAPKLAATIDNALLEIVLADSAPSSIEKAEAVLVKLADSLTRARAVFDDWSRLRAKLSNVAKKLKEIVATADAVNSKDDECSVKSALDGIERLIIEARGALND